jgi:D-3-phosphoglycerate dehydrogenase
MPNVLCTPHLGASTKEAQTGVAVEAARLLIDFFSTGSIKSSVNVSPLDRSVLESLSGLLNVAYRLGLLMAEVYESPPARCTLRYEGEVAKRDCSLLSAAFAAGLLERAMELEVSIINSQFLLRDRGIELVEQKSSDTGAFRNLITAEIDNNGCTATASGTILGNSIAGLVQMDDSQLECRLEGNLLVTRHSDTPGVIGRIGEVCGKHGVNIAYLSVSRSPGEPTGTQVGVLMLDSDPPEETIEELLALEPVQRAAIVHLPPANELPPWMRGSVQ